MDKTNSIILSSIVVTVKLLSTNAVIVLDMLGRTRAFNANIASQAMKIIHSSTVVEYLRDPELHLRCRYY